jgi:cytochrome c-type biogenesis protein CcmH/NrfG
MLYLSRRPRENRDTKNAMTATAAVQRYNRVNIVAALAIALAVSLLAYARIGGYPWVTSSTST